MLGHIPYSVLCIPTSDFARFVTFFAIAPNPNASILSSWLLLTNPAPIGVMVPFGSSIPPHPPPTDLDPTADQLLLSALSSTASTFLQPPPSLHAACLLVAKRHLDPLAVATSAATERRLQQSRKKRKRGEAGQYTSADVLGLTQVHVQGFDVTQVWEQARRILNASIEETERALSEVTRPLAAKGQPTFAPRDSVHDEHQQTPRDIGEERVEGDQWDPGSGSDGDEGSEADHDEAELAESEDRQSFMVEDESADGNSIDGHGSGESMGSSNEALLESREESGRVFVPDKNGLNDPFFSIDDFNKQSQFFEQQDARGELNDEDPSEDEDIDWTADPLKAAPPQNGPSFRGNQGDEQDSTDDDDGPTFGHADLDAPDSDQDIQSEEIDTMQNTNDIKYADFFAPPARQGTKLARRRALPKTQPSPNPVPEPELDIQRTISGVRRDIFEDDVSQADRSSEGPSDAGAPSDGKPFGQSNHQRRQAALAAEIRKLEAANVAKRDWTLSGEARAADRPINSLLEEDLDFERAGKPVPVITNEVSEDIEALIKRRIVAREFDEVIRRRPDNLATGGHVRRGRFELDDTKPQQSLAEIYEAEHLKTHDPEGYVDPNNAKLQEQQAAIEALWKEVSAKLDGLSSLHFKPKPPTATITVVSDVPAITMEDARPSAGGDVDGPSMLAPQEVYKVGDGRTRADRVREVVRKGGAVIGREEMGREERRRARRREKERARKRGGVENQRRSVADGSKASPKSGNPQARRKRDEAKQVEATLKRGGVRIIGRNGEIRDVQGREVKDKDKDRAGNDKRKRSNF